MSTAINGVLLAVSGSLAASITAKATIVAALGLIGAGLARKRRAALRHALLAATFGVLLFLPVAALVAPPVDIALMGAAGERVLPGTAAATYSAAPAHTRVGVPSADPQARFSPSTLLLMLWIAGAALFLAPVAMGMWQVRTLRRSALPWQPGQPAAGRLARDAGIHRRVDVLLHGALPGPITCGVMHPAILLPEDAPSWDAEDLNRALIHELEHVRRGDWVSHCLARGLCAVYWFLPLVWIAWRRLLVEAERSCDDAVLRRSEATAYADQLVGLARRLAAVAKGPAAKSPLLAMANRADLATRVGAVLDGRQQRGRAGTLAVSLACAAAMVLVVTVSPLRVVAAPQAAANAAPNVKFISTTSLVLTAVIVSDSSGGSVDGLAANDFAVTEDGRPQNISVFEFQKVDSQASNPPLSSYYVIGYYTGQRADGNFRKIQITGKEARMAKLDYRPGYYANQPSAGADTGGMAAGVAHSMPDVRPPVLIFKKDPAYSDEARKAKYQGSVLLSVEIDESGRPTNIRVLRSLGMGLDEKAVEALSQWRFKPGTKDGQPVTVQSQVEMNFQLQ